VGEEPTLTTAFGRKTLAFFERAARWPCTGSLGSRLSNGGKMCSARTERYDDDDATVRDAVATDDGRDRNKGDMERQPARGQPIRREGGVAGAKLNLPGTEGSGRRAVERFGGGARGPRPVRKLAGEAEGWSLRRALSSSSCVLVGSLGTEVGRAT
jgi:hypothetical protein